MNVQLKLVEDQFESLQALASKLDTFMIFLKDDNDVEDNVINIDNPITLNKDNANTVEAL